jgi:catalase (peroxidase I)
VGACQKTAVRPSTATNICSIYKSIKTSFDAATSDKSALSSIYGVAVRLAFHDAGEVDLNSVDSNGPDGCLAQVGDSSGLLETTSLVTTLIEPMWQQYCDKMSRADFWVLFAKLSLEKSSAYNMSIPFHFGRVDNAVCDTGAGRLPAAGLGLDEFKRVFVNQMGLTLSDAGNANV